VLLGVVAIHAVRLVTAWPIPPADVENPATWRVPECETVPQRR
jgi:hypothetical protein